MSTLKGNKDDGAYNSLIITAVMALSVRNGGPDRVSRFIIVRKHDQDVSESHIDLYF
jgi:hypothetical protein